MREHGDPATGNHDVVDCRLETRSGLEQQLSCELIGHLGAHDEAGINAVACDLKRLVRPDPEALLAKGVQDILL